MKDIVEQLAREIFSKSFDELTALQREFVSLQNRWWKLYYNKVRDLVCQAEGKQKLTSHERNIIKQYYFDRVPPSVIMNAIMKGVEAARQQQRPVWSIGFFRSWIKAEFAYYQAQVDDPRARFNNCDKWLFKIYVEYKEGRLGKMRFHPFMGYIR
jgi:hypothetical protein